MRLAEAALSLALSAPWLAQAKDAEPSPEMKPSKGKAKAKFAALNTDGMATGPAHIPTVNVTPPPNLVFGDYFAKRFDDGRKVTVIPPSKFDPQSKLAVEYGSLIRSESGAGGCNSLQVYPTQLPSCDKSARHVPQNRRTSNGIRYWPSAGRWASLGRDPGFRPFDQPDLPEDGHETVLSSSARSADPHRRPAQRQPGRHQHILRPMPKDAAPDLNILTATPNASTILRKTTPQNDC